MAPNVDGHQWLVAAFVDLSTCRPIGMDVGPIPLTAIQEYADRHSLGDLFVYQIRAIDNAYMTQRAKKHG